MKFTGCERRDRACVGGRRTAAGERDAARRPRRNDATMTTATLETHEQLQLQLQLQFITCTIGITY